MNGTRKCSAISCTRESEKRGMCAKHYLRWWKATPPEARAITPWGLPCADRFDLKVSKSGHSGCWMWTGSARPSGHGVAIVDGKQTSAPAASLIFSGKPRPGGALALHRCDNPGCVNPKHLYWGTHQDNADDAWARNRHQAGEERPAAVLTESHVIEIREKYAAGAPGPDLAAAYGVSRPTVYNITAGTKWKSVGGPRTRRRPQRKVK